MWGVNGNPLVLRSGIGNGASRLILEFGAFSVGNGTFWLAPFSGDSATAVGALRQFAYPFDVTLTSFWALNANPSGAATIDYVVRVGGALSGVALSINSGSAITVSDLASELVVPADTAIEVQLTSSGVAACWPRFSMLATRTN